MAANLLRLHLCTEEDMVKKELRSFEAVHAIEVLSRLDPRLERREGRMTESFLEVSREVGRSLITA
eukprot:6351477-Alexandrium_andersonii.AAC.1